MISPHTRTGMVIGAIYKRRSEIPTRNSGDQKTLRLADQCAHSTQCRTHCPCMSKTGEESSEVLEVASDAG